MRVNPFGYIAVSLLLFLGACGTVSISPVTGGRPETIKVLIVKGVRGATGLEVKTSRDGAQLSISRESPGVVSVNGSAKTLPLYFAPDNDFIYVNGRPYRGTLAIIEQKDSFSVVNELPVEEYVAGIINNEISSRWHTDAVKAQAVIARTYALHQKKKRAAQAYHVEGTVMGQVYNGAGTEDAAARKAVRDTTGQMLYYNDEPALAVYHSNAGGMTDASSDVWKADYPYLASVASPYDESYPRFYWEYTVPAEALKETLNKAGHEVSEPDSVFPESVTRAGRIKTLVVKDVDYKKITLSGEEMRKLLGYGNLRSTIFDVTKDSGVFVFKGKGSGHGVGLSQWGAKGMAEKGRSYKEILRHYYPGTELVRAY